MKTFLIFSIVASVSSALLFPVEVISQEITIGSSKIGNFGTIVQPTQPAPVRTAPPGIWTQPGKQIGETSQTSNYVIMGGKQIQSFFGVDRWVNIAPIATDGTVQTNQSGWTYWGSGDNSSSENFVVKNGTQFTPEIKNKILESVQSIKRRPG